MEAPGTRAQVRAGESEAGQVRGGPSKERAGAGRTGRGRPVALTPALSSPTFNDDKIILHDTSWPRILGCRGEHPFLMIRGSKEVLSAD